MGFSKSSIYLLLFLFTSVNSYSQIDTTSIRLEIDLIVTPGDHKKYWNEISEKDQTLRGRKANKENDLRNLISASYYFNKFGYPDPDIAGEESDIITIIWIHNSCPLLLKKTFPIILEAYEQNYINEKDFREYYLRGLYLREFKWEQLLINELDTIFSELKLSTESSINIQDALIGYDACETFLNQEHELIGLWDDPKNQQEIKLFRDNSNVCYLHKIYHDGSHYPQRIIQHQEYKNLFKLDLDSEFYYGIQANGELTIKDKSGKRNCPPISN